MILLNTFKKLIAVYLISVALSRLKEWNAKSGKISGIGLSKLRAGKSSGVDKELSQKVSLIGSGKVVDT